DTLDTNELLSKILGKLENLEHGQKILEQGQTNLEHGQATLEQRQANLEQGQATLKQGVETLEQGQKITNERLTNIEVIQENVTNKNIQLLFEAQQESASRFSKLDRIEMTLNTVKSDTEVIKTVVTEHSQSIRELKTAQ
ncbi:MAG: hypothetical protein ACERKO_00390, partial [Acetanaerobacterium sp.]